MQALQICAVALSFFSLLLLLISLGSNYWIENTDAHMGLWSVCSSSSCATIPNISGELNAVRAFMLLGMIAGAISLFGLCATFFKSHLGSISLATASGVASLTAGLCAMIAMSVFTANVFLIGSWFGWSFGLGWASFPLFLITSGPAFAAERVTAA